MALRAHGLQSGRWRGLSKGGIHTSKVSSRGRKWSRDVTVHIGIDKSLQNSKYFLLPIRCERWKPLGYDCIAVFCVDICTNGSRAVVGKADILARVSAVVNS